MFLTNEQEMFLGTFLIINQESMNLIKSFKDGTFSNSDHESFLNNKDDGFFSNGHETFLSNDYETFFSKEHETYMSNQYETCSSN